MTVLLNVVLPVFIVAGVAALAHLWLRFEARTLSRAVFYVFGPAFVFDSLSRSEASGTALAQITAAVLLTVAALWVLGWLAARLLRLEGPTRAAFLVSILLMNAGNFGLSVNLFAFGDAGLSWASVYFTLSALLSASLGTFLSAGGRASAREALRRVAGVPFIYAAALGLLFTLGDLSMPQPLAKAIGLLGQASVPVMLTVLGVRLAETLRARQRLAHLPALGVASLMRLIVSPALAFFFANLVGLAGVARDVTVLQSAMPTAVITTILATEFDSDPPFAALCVLATTLLSLPTLTILLNLLMP
jgi:predicted permease